ncbi:hypothetical protein BOTCAL_0012g00040 [Botryotinia calthae]|uniref:Uncharacterized protein n=1 Tax=Botryotinia calthae TaxID=38488 RepID=A0A4Y8DIR8_9HELO|nr:hypothetical protein BOTCAL_0012g00040 [Botryotinia calthae]
MVPCLNEGVFDGGREGGRPGGTDRGEEEGFQGGEVGEVDVFDGEIMGDAEGVGVEVRLAPLEEEIGLDFGSEFGGGG